jgi:hypothetical protein
VTNENNPGFLIQSVSGKNEPLETSRYLVLVSTLTRAGAKVCHVISLLGKAPKIRKAS